MSTSSSSPPLSGSSEKQLSASLASHAFNISSHVSRNVSDSGCYNTIISCSVTQVYHRCTSAFANKKTSRCNKCQHVCPSLMGMLPVGVAVSRVQCSRVCPESGDSGEATVLRVADHLDELVPGAVGRVPLLHMTPTRTQRQARLKRSELRVQNPVSRSARRLILLRSATRKAATRLDDPRRCLRANCTNRKPSSRLIASTTKGRHTFKTTAAVHQHSSRSCLHLFLEIPTQRVADLPELGSACVREGKQADRHPVHQVSGQRKMSL